ncbi:unnamed protein product [marine sediment metagenome]|uniref:Uncharacterized protein n=1 Tax=marine sediment metagenome TaxID=412755 RepID=X1K7V0_9ZZZZ
MNPLEIQIEAGKVIEAYARCSNGPGVIGVLDCGIEMLKPNHGNVYFQGVQTLTIWQIRNGLDSQQWKKLSEKLGKLL